MRPGFDPITENTEGYIADSGCVAGTYYGSPIDMSSRMYLGMGIDFTKGTLTSVTFTVEVLTSKDSWQALYCGDGATQWQIACTADTDMAVHVGGYNIANAHAAQPIVWSQARIKYVVVGSDSASSLTVYLGAK